MAIYIKIKDILVILKEETRLIYALLYMIPKMVIVNIF